MTDCIITKRPDGEYSTTIIDNIIETCWFGADGESRVIGRTVVPQRTVAAEHIAAWEARQ